jgi:integrase
MNEYEIIRASFPRVVKYEKRGQTYFYVDLRSKTYGTKGRRGFSTKQEAVDYASDFFEKLKNGQVVQDGIIKDRQLEKWKERLAVYGKTIEDACQSYLAELAENKKREVLPLVKDLCQTWETEKLTDTLDPKRPKTKIEISQYGRWIRRELGERHVYDITEDECRRLLNEMNRSNTTKKQHWRYLNMFLLWCNKKGHIQHVPTASIKIKIKEPEAHYYSVEQASKIMELAKSKYPELIAYYALCLFDGLRPTEAESTEWKDIGFTTKEIFVAGLTPKDDRRHFMHDTCLEWLRYSRDLGLPVIPINCQGKQRDFREELGIEWIQDGLRHTFATYYKALGHSLEKIRDHLGHTTSRITKTHYQRSIAKDEATKFWSILPAPEQVKT